MKKSPSPLGPDPPSKARWWIADSGGLHPRALAGTFVEDTDAQEAEDDIIECLHGLVHNRLSMCMFGLAWCKWSDALGPWTPAVPANTGHNKVKSDSSVLGIFTVVPFCLLLQLTAYHEDGHLGKSIRNDTQSSNLPVPDPVLFWVFFIITGMRRDQSPYLPPAGAGHVPSMGCDSMIVVS